MTLRTFLTLLVGLVLALTVCPQVLGSLLRLSTPPA